jgi:gamma-glutamyl hercynylcysteine S-oxide synthase
MTDTDHPRPSTRPDRGTGADGVPGATAPGTPAERTPTWATDQSFIATELQRARARTLALLDVSEAEQRAQHSRLMSPLVWDLAHIGNYEELWLLRAIDGRAAIDESLDDLYNAFEHPRWERPSLPILGPTEARAYDAEVRAQVLELLDRVDLSSDAPDPLLAAGFVYGMVIQHEHQHDETLVATRQLMGDASRPPPGTIPAPGVSTCPVDPATIPTRRRIDGGLHTVGTDAHPWAYDNERRSHAVELMPFAIDTFPVTNRRFLEFIADGGYTDERHWSGAGWAWRNEAGLYAPEFWHLEGPERGGVGGSWSVLRFGARLDLADLLDEPVQHVGWHEAEAFARWSDCRLPTEVEWEAAAAGIDPVYPLPVVPRGRIRRADRRTSPSGPLPRDDRPDERAHRVDQEAELTVIDEQRANLGQRHTGPAAIGSYPAGVSAHGVHQLLGDVWEWTSSDFRPHPGFRAFPYKEYSEVFWGNEYKVLKGGSWAADPCAVRPTFRNWDYPIRRQIFSGFRTAVDA